MQIQNRWIVLETTDGGGKDTQAIELQKNAKERYGINAIIEKEPTDGQTDIGNIIRSILQGKTTCSFYELQRLFTLDRNIHVEKIQELLKTNWVISVRYKFSTICYSMATHKIHPDKMSSDQLNTIIKLNTILPNPDLTFILDVPAEISMERIEKRGEGKELFDKLEFQKAVRESYQEIALKNSFVITIPNGSIETVSSNIINKIQDMFF